MTVVAEPVNAAALSVAKQGRRTARTGSRGQHDDSQLLDEKFFNLKRGF